MPSFSTLSDNFNDGVIGPSWGNSYGGANETGGQARVPCIAGSYAGYQTAYSWTMAGATIFMKVATVPAASTATEAYCGVMVNAPGIEDVASANYGTRVGFIINTVTGLIRFKSESGYFDAASVDITYNATTHAFLRLRETGGNLYWDTSPDGTTWTNRRTLATPAWITAAVDQCALDMSAHRDAGTTDYAAYDLFNTLSNGAVWDASAALSGETSLTVTVKAIANATAALTGESGLTATTKLTANMGATLAGETSLDASFSDGTSLPEEVAGLAAGDWDLEIEQGATFSQTFDCTVDDPAFTWAGFTARAQIRTDASATADLLLDLTPYLTIVGGTVHLDIPAAATATITRNGRWDLELVLGAGVVRLLKGKAIIDPEVTR